MHDVWVRKSSWAVTHTNSWPVIRMLNILLHVRYGTTWLVNFGLYILLFCTKTKYSRMHCHKQLLFYMLTECLIHHVLALMASDTANHWILWGKILGTVIYNDKIRSYSP